MKKVMIVVYKYCPLPEVLEKFILLQYCNEDLRVNFNEVEVKRRLS